MRTGMKRLRRATTWLKWKQPKTLIPCGERPHKRGVREHLKLTKKRECMKKIVFFSATPLYSLSLPACIAKEAFFFCPVTDFEPARNNQPTNQASPVTG